MFKTQLEPRAVRRVVSLQRFEKFFASSKFARKIKEALRILWEKPTLDA